MVNCLRRGEILSPKWCCSAKKEIRSKVLRKGWQFRGQRMGVDISISSTVIRRRDTENVEVDGSGYGGLQVASEKSTGVSSFASRI